MDLKWLQTFITIYEEGSFRAAADKLFISQPSITVHIKNLEEELQIKLFERDHTKINLTPAAHKYYQSAKALLNNVSQATIDIQEYVTGHEERITIGITAELLSSPILKKLHKFQTVYPNYYLKYVNIHPHQIDEYLLNKKVDLVISLEKAKISILHNELLLQERPLLVSSSKINISHLRKNEQYKFLLKNYPLLTGFLSSHSSIIDYLQQEYPIKQIQFIEEAFFAIKLMREGLGVSIISNFLIEEELQLNTLQIIGEASPIFPIEIYMNYRKNEAYLLPFLTYIRTTFIEIDKMHY